MSIWFQQQIQLANFKDFGKNTLGDLLGMEFTEIGANFIKATMPVDHRTKQPYGLLHGGASVALAETLGSVASGLVIDPTKFHCVGLEINANHVRGVSEGFVTGIATPVHIGGSTHIWDIKIYDQQDRLVCISRLTVAILQKR
ncbi:MAG: hotdog fold thioesterase [Bacteroidetes bacterium]|nr:hotdog fold thioesterase [Bacteroidota bacterium]